MRFVVVHVPEAGKLEGELLSSGYVVFYASRCKTEGNFVMRSICVLVSMFREE